MARAIHRLTGADLRRRQPGAYADGGGLWLQVSRSKDGKQINRSWLFCYAAVGREREMGLGSLFTVSLAEAREAALQCRKQRLAGIDPIDRRRAERAAGTAARAKLMTFDQCAAAFIAAHRNEWRSERHAKQWPTTLTAFASPTIGRTPVAEVDTAAVVKVLEPIWYRVTETAKRLRGRIEAVLDWAVVGGYRPPGDNPARWAGHLEHLFASPSKLKGKRHLAALPFREVPAFIEKLRAVPGTMARAIEFTVLTACRRSEVLGACWDEIDVDNRIWVVPARRTKGLREHSVPLCDRTLEIIAEQRAVRRDAFVFPGPLKYDAGPLLRSLGCTATLHGFRSSFRDWCGEETTFPREVAEAALGHRTGNAVEQAYRRGSALQKRRLVMDAWAAFCAKPLQPGAVVPLRWRGHA
jgi:integrase